MIKALLVDLDGVIWARGPQIHFDALNYALGAFGQAPIDKVEHLSRFNGLGTKEKLEILIPNNKSLTAAIHTLKQIKTEEAIRTMEPDENVTDFLKLVRGPVQIGLVTNSLRPTTLQILDRMEITQFFDVIITASDVYDKKKPHPYPYQKAAFKFNLPPAQCLAIDDTKHGVESAVGAGCVTWEITKPENLRLAKLWEVMGKIKNGAQLVTL